MKTKMSMKNNVFYLVSGLVSLLAVVFASSACIVVFYQPKVPKTLQSK